MPESAFDFLLTENVGRRVSVLLSEGTAVVGELAEVHSDYITIARTGGTDIRHYAVRHIAGVSFA